jgi:DNA-binding FadR family transcriptional regulator
MSKKRRQVYFEDHERGLRAYEDHFEIFKAIEGCRPAQAEKRMSQHLSQALATWQILLGVAAPAEYGRLKG